jgi:hypothetical protein
MEIPERRVNFTTSSKFRSTELIERRKREGNELGKKMIQINW